jgi:hypothetical protein
MNSIIKYIVIANGAEAFMEIIAGIRNVCKRKERIEFENYLANRSVFWEGCNKIVITPRPIDKDILDCIFDRLHYKNIINLSPRKQEVALSTAILKDKRLFAQVVRIINKNPNLIITSYAYTKEFQELVNALRKLKLQFRVDNEPDNGGCMLVKRLDSKVGFREEVSKINHKAKKIDLPKYFVCNSKSEVLASVRSLYKQGLSCIVKASMGEGGGGV